MGRIGRLIVECVFTGLSCVVVLATCLAPCTAQIPDEFTNLQILDKDISKPELIGVMKDFAGALGVRCKFCHVGDDPNSLEGYDFASDEKHEKQAARQMMRMVEVVNEDYIARLDELFHGEHEQGEGDGESEEEHGGEHAAEVRVACVTCHRGQAKPVLIGDVLDSAYRAGGVDSVATKYERLRAEYYGRHTFDFGEWVLIDLADEIARREQDIDVGLRLLRLNAEWFPESAIAHVAIGRTLFQKGDVEAARASIEKALDLDPDNAMAKQLLERLEPR